MKKLLLLTIIFTCAGAASASAEYGTWEKIYGLDAPPGLSNAAFMSLGIGDPNNLYTAGMQQTGALSLIYGWDSHTGGTSWEEMYGMDLSGISDDCDMMQMFSMVTTAGAASPQKAVLGGIQVDPECVEQNEFPACMFLCIFQIQTMILYTDDGGVTLQQAQVTGGGLYRLVMGIDFVDENVGYAAGGPNLLLRTQDGGATWNAVSAPEGLANVYNDVEYLDENLGFLVSGMPEEEKKSGDDPESKYQRLMHQFRYIKDPIYRMQWKEEHPDGGAKGTLGKIFRTVDGGQTWDMVLEDANMSMLNIEMADADNGWVLAEPHTGKYPLVLWHTADGGDTWEDVTSTLPQEVPNALKWAVGELAIQPAGQVGFIGGVGQNILSYQPVLFYTADGGATWQTDESVVELGNPILQIKWANNKLAFSVGFELSVFRYTQANVAPKADAGDDQTVAVGAAVTLDGSGSSDPDGDTLTYLWTQTAGATVILSADNVAQPTFAPDQTGDLTFTLTVDDGLESDTDEVVITVTENPTDDDANDDVADDDAADDDAADDDNDSDDDSGGDDDDDSGGCGC